MATLLKLNYLITPFSLRMIIKFIVCHMLAIYGFYLGFSGQSNWKTIIFFLGTFLGSGLSITVGAHRLFCHRCFEAKRPLRLFLLFWFNYTAQYSLFDWVLDHRVHHKFSDTDADPYNIKRGMIYAQFGWVCLERTKQFKEKSKTIDMSDLKSDPDIMFQHKYFPALLSLHWAIFALIPCYFWKESLMNSSSTLILGFIVLLNHTQLINSVCHSWGWKPYDTGIEPTFYRLATYLTNGEGYHNFHHAFPYDYSASELKWTQNYNPSTLAIDLFRYLGWVKNVRVAPPSIIKQRRLRTGNFAIKTRPWNVVLDYIAGLLSVTWPISIMLSIRYFYFN